MIYKTSFRNNGMVALHPVESGRLEMLWAVWALCVEDLIPKIAVPPFFMGFLIWGAEDFRSCAVFPIAVSRCCCVIARFQAAGEQASSAYHGCPDAPLTSAPDD